MSRPSWLVTQPDSPRRTTSTPCRSTRTAARCSASRPMRPTRCRIRSSSPWPSSAAFATRASCAPGSTRSRATSACAGCGPGTPCPPSRRLADLPTQTAEVGIATERAELTELVRAAIDGLNPRRAGRHRAEPGRRPRRRRTRRRARGVAQPRPRAAVAGPQPAGTIPRRADRGAHGAAGLFRVLEAMLTGWDGQMTVLMRKRISRHIDQCKVCGERKRRELTPFLVRGRNADRRAVSGVP